MIILMMTERNAGLQSHRRPMTAIFRLQLALPIPPLSRRSLRCQSAARSILLSSRMVILSGKRVKSRWYLSRVASVSPRSTVCSKPEAIADSRCRQRLFIMVELMSYHSKWSLKKPAGDIQSLRCTMLSESSSLPKNSQNSCPILVRHRFIFQVPSQWWRPSVSN